MAPQFDFDSRARPRVSATALTLGLQTYTYDDRRLITPAVASALDRCGAWVLERSAASVTRSHLRFEVQLRGAVDLYSALIGAGLEFTRSSHLALTHLCTLRNHQSAGREPFRTVSVELEISFLDELELSHSLLTGQALA